MNSSLKDKNDNSVGTSTSEVYEGDKENVPVDKYNAAYLLMVFFGIGGLLPWNAILTALDFFNEKVSSAGYRPDFVFGFAVDGIQLFTSVLNMIYGHKLSYVVRISGSFLIISVLMFILPFVTNGLDAKGAWTADIIILVIFGIFGGIV
jgi:hypothetical protein